MSTLINKYKYIKSFYCSSSSSNKIYYIKDNNNASEGRVVNIGDKNSFVKTFTEKDVILFSELSGDKNPIHLDKEYAKENISNNKLFNGKCLIHGSLVASLISTVVSNSLPGSIYLKQELNFKSPTFINDTIKAETEITNITGKKIYFNTKCYKTNNTSSSNDDDNIVIEGPAIIYHPNLYNSKK